MLAENKSCVIDGHKFLAKGHPNVKLAGHVALGKLLHFPGVMPWGSLTATPDQWDGP